MESNDSPEIPDRGETSENAKSEKDGEMDDDTITGLKTSES